MKRSAFYSNCRLAVLLFSVFFTLVGEELKGKVPEVKDNNGLDEDGFNEEKSNYLDSMKLSNGIPYNSDIPEFVCHGDIEVTLFDSKSKRKIGTDTFHFHFNLGMKMVGAEELSASYGNKYFKVEKKNEGIYLLTTESNDANMGDLKIEVLINANSQDISGRMSLTKPGEKPDVKLFKGTYVPKKDK